MARWIGFDTVPTSSSASARAQSPVDLRLITGRCSSDYRLSPEDYDALKTWLDIANTCTLPPRYRRRQEVPPLREPAEACPVFVEVEDSCQLYFVSAEDLPLIHALFKSYDPNQSNDTLPYVEGWAGAFIRSGLLRQRFAAY